MEAIYFTRITSLVFSSHRASCQHDTILFFSFPPLPRSYETVIMTCDSLSHNNKYHVYTGAISPLYLPSEGPSPRKLYTLMLLQ